MANQIKEQLFKKARWNIIKDLFVSGLITIALMTGGSTVIGILAVSVGVVDPQIIGMLGFFNGFFIYAVYLRPKILTIVNKHYGDYVQKLKELEREKS